MILNIGFLQCEQFLETNEDEINSWYFGEQSKVLQAYLCPQVLKDSKCLSEPYGENIKSEESSEKAKGDTANKIEL